jgi:Uma2 family endonuclease
MNTLVKPRTWTAAEYLRKYLDATGFELVQGRIRRTPVPTPEHAFIEVNTSTLLNAFAKANKLGRVYGGEVKIQIQTTPPTIRMADVCFMSFKKIPASVPPSKKPFRIMPELVVEIKSDTDRHKAIRVKTEEYLTAGVKVVMVIDPEIESVAVFRDEELPIRFHNGDTVTIPDVLPGFAAPVKAFFE